MNTSAAPAVQESTRSGELRPKIEALGDLLRWAYGTPRRRAPRRDPLNARLADRLRQRLVRALERGSRRSSAVRDLGCSLDELRAHLEARFEPGMTWENWGRNGWHIDHIRPLASFDLTDPEQQRAAVHYTNLRPLWSWVNQAKGSRYTEFGEEAALPR